MPFSGGDVYLAKWLLMILVFFYFWFGYIIFSAQVTIQGVFSCVVFSLSLDFVNSVYFCLSLLNCIYVSDVSIPSYVSVNTLLTLKVKLLEYYQ